MLLCLKILKPLSCVASDLIGPAVERLQDHLYRQSQLHDLRHENDLPDQSLLAMDSSGFESPYTWRSKPTETGTATDFAFSGTLLQSSQADLPLYLVFVGLRSNTEDQ
jgi:hypothetical protein